jgi:hypothetical protein
MAEATPSLPRNNSSFYIAGATVTLALMRARQAVKDTLRRKGEKVSSFPASEITAMAKAYLAEHRELIVEARATVERWTLEGVFGSGHAITVLLKSLMNSRRLMGFTPLAENHLFETFDVRILDDRLVELRERYVDQRKAPASAVHLQMAGSVYCVSPNRWPTWPRVNIQVASLVN